MDYTTDNPHKLGYRMPAEWENHAATWLSWPHQKEDWPGKFQPIPWVYAEIIRHIAAHEVVKLVIPSNEHKVKIRKILQASGVLIAFSDGDTQNLRNLRQLAGNAVANGMEPEAALAAITLNPANTSSVTTS